MLESLPSRLLPIAPSLSPMSTALWCTTTITVKRPDRSVASGQQSLMSGSSFTLQRISIQNPIQSRTREATS
jgi:hypothetical protein